jgi:hypothetical protein
MFLAKCKKHGTVRGYKAKGYKNGYRCGICADVGVNNWRIKRREELIDNLGGKCFRCGYNKCRQALEFHHIDPGTKLFELSVTGMRKNASKEEAKKCILLCANCHREIENWVVW